MKEPEYEVVWPIGKSAYEIVPPAQSTSDLSGKTVCELWDFEFQGEYVFPRLRELLSKRYPGIKFIDYNHFGNIHGAKEVEIRANLPKLLRKHNCDVVICGIGA